MDIEPSQPADGQTLDPSLDLVGRGMTQWRRERPDIDCSGKAIVGRILHLHDVILRRVNDALTPHGLRYPSYAVLATLRVSGPPFQMSPSRLTETLLLSSGGLSNLLARLERNGWILRRADPVDGRAVIVELTESGQALADRAMADHAAMERALVAMFSAAEQQAYAALLSRMMVLNGLGVMGHDPREGLPKSLAAAGYAEPEPTNDREVET